MLGKIDINKLKKITTEERMVKFHIQVRGWLELPRPGQSRRPASCPEPRLAAQNAIGLHEHYVLQAAGNQHPARSLAIRRTPPAQEYERCGQFIFPVCSRLAGRQIDQTFGIMDVKGGWGRGPRFARQLLWCGAWGAGLV